MIQKIDINGVHSVVDDDLRKYVMKKIGKLDQYMPKHARTSAHAEIKLKESKAKDKKECTCEVALRLPQEVIMINESTINMYAAIDIAEAKLKTRLKKYKDLHANPRLHRRLLLRFQRDSA
ncbi:MAG TPA: ribosome-associated translation inhibitor RaiA [Nevskiaceae bacterium]|nr:ribosome-associated translation inhibitor RaiA [Nevskiaceae bacterium]